MLFDSVDDMLDRRQRYAYGRRGTPTTEALETAVTALEGAAGTVLCPSGLVGLTTALLSCLAAGDQLLMVDCVYAPARHFAETRAEAAGRRDHLLRPADRRRHRGARSASARARSISKSPGSLTFEMQDVPAIAAVAHARGAGRAVDNTWATPLFFKPLDHGVDLSIQAGDQISSAAIPTSMLGTVAANENAWPRLKETARATSASASGRTTSIWRCAACARSPSAWSARWQSALKIADWLAARPGGRAGALSRRCRAIRATPSGSAT